MSSSDIKRLSFVDDIGYTEFEVSKEWYEKQPNKEDVPALFYSAFDDYSSMLNDLTGKYYEGDRQSVSDPFIGLNWKQAAEHLRDRGHTWGPGIDDAPSDYTEDEMKRGQAEAAAYKQKLQEYSVPPRKEFVEAGQELKSSIPSSEDISFGRAPVDWREEHSDKEIKLCKAACESLGYILELGYGKSKDSFAVSVDYHGWLPGRGGNIHKFFVSGIKSIEDCLQLVADFSAIGARPTTWYKDNFHYSTRNTGELRMELIRRFGLQEFENKVPSLDAQIQSAAARAAKAQSIAGMERVNPEPEI